jgi:hypothetical protein
MFYKWAITVQLWDQSELTIPNSPLKYKQKGNHTNCNNNYGDDYSDCDYYCNCSF